MKNIEALIEDGGDVTLGAIYPIVCAATASDGHNALAMLVRRDGETLNALLNRLDKAIANVLASGTRTKDIAAPGANAVGTQDVGDAIVKELEAQS